MPDDLDFFSDFEPAQLLDEWHDEYAVLHQALLQDLMTLRTNLRLVHRLVEFPFHFYAPENRLFGFLAVNLYEYSLAILYRIGRDNSGDAIGVTAFRNSVLRYLGERYREDLTALSKAQRPDEAARATLDRVTAVRHQRIGHRNREFIIRGEGEWPSLTELDHVAENLSRYFNAVSFPVVRDFVDNHLEGELEAQLDALALSSSWSALYDTDRRAWRELVFDQLPFVADREARIQDLDERRRGAGLAPIEWPDVMAA